MVINVEPTRLERLKLKVVPRVKTRTPPKWRLVDSPTLIRAKRRVAAKPWFFLVVIAPTILVAIYYLLFAAPQYISEAQFVIRGSQASTGSIFGQVLGAAGLSQANEETSAVNAFLASHDAVGGLEQRLPLLNMFRQNGIDIFEGIPGNPSPERLLGYYRRHISTGFNSGTGITTLKVRMFRPEDSRQIASNLLDMSESLVNQFTSRAEANTLRSAQNELRRAEGRLISINAQLTQFRTRANSIDPSKSSAMVSDVIGAMEQQLALARVALAQDRSVMQPGSVAMVQLQKRIDALEEQIDLEKGRLTGGDTALAPAVAEYDRLMLEREYADRDYTSALASLEASRLDAARQHLYLVRVVQPNLPLTSQYPDRLVVIFTVFVSLLVAYGIGWLIIAGVREHAA